MLAIALLLTSGLAVQDPLCARALEAAPGLTCIATGHGVALAEKPGDAETFAGYARGAEARFQAHFGQPIAPYALVLTPPAPGRAAMTAAGFQHFLPWPSPEAFAEAAQRGIERAARGFAASQNMSAEQADQVVARAMANRPTAEGQAALNAGIVPHELAHLWFTAAFFPAPPPEDGQRHYGGTGPDWLDEAAAVVVEDDATADLRRDQFRLLMRGETTPALGSEDSRPTLLDLPHLLTRDHPGLSRLPPPPPSGPPGMGPSGGVAVTYTPAGSGPRPDVAERLYYVQIRVFADYLIQKSGRADILADIARGLANGGSFEAWLARDGAAHRLPTSIAALHQDWTAFAERF